MNCGGRITMFLSLVLFVGCSEPERGGPRAATSPVKGSVTVDGVAADFLQIECHPEAGAALQYPVSKLTDEKGQFTLGTYEAEDGLPEGTYTLTFTWMGPGLLQADRLKGAYADPKKSTQKITVVKGQETNVGTIELSTKGRKTK